MARKSEAEIEFKVTDSGFKEKIKEYSDELKKNRQELTLEQEQMKHNSSEQEKLENSLVKLKERYDIQNKVVQTTSERLDNAKKHYGENSVEVKRLEKNLTSAQIYEQKLANQIKETSDKVKTAKGEFVTYSDKMKDLENKEKQVTAQTKIADAEFNKLKATTKKSAGSYEVLSASQKNLATHTEATKQKMELMREKLVLTEQEFGKNSRQATELKSKMAELEVEFAKTKKEADLLVGVKLNKLTGHIDTAKVKALGNSFSKVGGKMKEVGGKASMYISTPIVAAMATSVKAATEYKEEVADIQKEVEAQGYTQKQVNDIMADFGNKSLQWSQQFGVSTEKVNDGMFELVSNGYNVKQAMGMMPELLKTMTANGDKTGASLQLTSSMLEQFGQNLGSNNEVIKNGNNIMGQMTEATHKSAMSLEDLQTISSNAGSAMHGMGVSTSDFLSIAGKLRSAGIDASSVGTGLSSMMTKLAAPTSQANALLQKYNVHVVDSHGNMRKMYDILGDMQGAYSKMNDAEKANFLKQTVGQENMKTGVTLMKAELGKYRELSSEIQNSTGTVDKYYKTMSNTPEAKMRRFKESIHALQIAVGQQLLPALTPLIAFFTKLIQGFSKLSPHTQKIIVVITAIVAVLGPIIVMIGTLIGAIGTIIPVITPIIGLLSGPFLAVIAVVVAAIIGVILVFKNWDKIVKWATKLWSGFSRWFGKLWQGLSKGISKIWKSITTFLSKTWTGIIKTAKKVLTPITNVFKFIFLLVQSVIQGIWTVITSMLKFEFMLIIKLAKTVFTPIVKFFSKIWGDIKKVTSSVWNGISNTIKSVATVISNFLKPIFKGIGNFIGSVWNSIRGVTSSIWNGISGLIRGIVHAISSTINNVFNAIKNTVSSIWSGVSSVTSSVWNGIKSVIGNIIHSISSTIGNVFNSLKSTVGDIFNGIKSAITGPIDEAKHIISGIVDSITSLFKGIHLSLPKIDMPPMPHFKFHGKFSLNPPSVPHLSVDWYAKGGLFNGPQVIGVGEAGQEAVLPLTNSNVMTSIAKTIAEHTPKELSNKNTSVQNNFQIDIHGDVDSELRARRMTEEITSRITQRFNQSRQAFS